MREVLHESTAFTICNEAAQLACLHNVGSWEEWLMDRLSARLVRNLDHFISEHLSDHQPERQALFSLSDSDRLLLVLGRRAVDERTTDAPLEALRSRTCTGCSERLRSKHCESGCIEQPSDTRSCLAEGRHDPRPDRDEDILWRLLEEASLDLSLPIDAPASRPRLASQREARDDVDDVDESQIADALRISRTIPFDGAGDHLPAVQSGPRLRKYRWLRTGARLRWHQAVLVAAAVIAIAVGPSILIGRRSTQAVALRGGANVERSDIEGDVPLLSQRPIRARFEPAICMIGKCTEAQPVRLISEGFTPQRGVTFTVEIPDGRDGNAGPASTHYARYSPTDEFGAFRWSWWADPESPTGIYRVSIRDDATGRFVTATFRISDPSAPASPGIVGIRVTSTVVRIAADGQPYVTDATFSISVHDRPSYHLSESSQNSTPAWILRSTAKRLVSRLTTGILPTSPTTHFRTAPMSGMGRRSLAEMPTSRTPGRQGRADSASRVPSSAHGFQTLDAVALAISPNPVDTPHPELSGTRGSPR